jgi:hypothetical protein
MRSVAAKLTTLALALLAPLTAQAAPKASRLCGSVAPGEHDVTHLPAVAKLPNGVTWMTDWAAQPETGGWYEMQAVDACRYRLDPDFKTWHGLAAARIEVDPGDDPLNLNGNSERAEGLLTQSVGGKLMLDDRSSGTQFYAISYFFPETWDATQYPWSAFAPKDCGADDSNACNSWSIVLQFHLKSARPWGFLYAAKVGPKAPQRYTLLFGDKPQPFSDGGPLALGKWTDFVFQIRWDANNVTAWRRDQGQKDFAKVIDEAPFSPPAQPVYLKQGLYRGGAVDGRTDVFWVGPTVRATSYAAATAAAFGDKN